MPLGMSQWIIPLSTYNLRNNYEIKEVSIMKIQEKTVSKCQRVLNMLLSLIILPAN